MWHFKTNFNGNITLSLLENSTFLLDNRVYEPVLPLRLLLDKRYCYIFFMLFVLCTKVFEINIVHGWTYISSVPFFMHHTLGLMYALLRCYRICYLLLQENPFSIFFPVDTYGPRTGQEKRWKWRILGS